MSPLKISHCCSQFCPAPLQYCVVIASTTSFLLLVKLQKRAQSLGEGKSENYGCEECVGLSHKLTKANE